MVPALRPDLPGFDPSLSSAVPTAVSSVGPRSAPRRSGFPGSQLASSPPATPGIELGSQPFVGAIPPASAFDLPTEADLGALPALLAGAAGLSPQTGIAAVGAASTGAPHYFLDSAHPTPPRTATLVNLKPRDAAFEFVPELGVSPPPGTPSGVPGSLPAAPTVSAGSSRGLETGGSPLTSAGEASAVSLYFLNETRSFSGAPAVEPAESRPELAADHASAHPGFDVVAVRRDFPILEERVHGHPLIWLDNAATTQKPRSVIDRLSYFYEHENSNIHRAAPRARRARDRCLRGGTGQGRPLSPCLVQRRDRLCPGHHRGHQPRRPVVGAEEHRPGRRDRHHVARAPRQHRTVATVVLREGSPAARRAGG